jgi:NSS family neurotransmitter:Na+ symporter
MPGGGVFMTLFFLGLSFAALTSLISMIELATRVLIDAGFQRRQALLTIGGAALILGLPSARSLDFFHNQDWVWGVGLMLSGLFFAVAARRFGLEKLRTEVINGEGADIQVGRWWTFLIAVVVPIEAVVLMVWWLWQARTWDPNWLDPLGTANVGTVLAQFAVALIVLWLLNGWLARKASGNREAAS